MHFQRRKKKTSYILRFISFLFYFYLPTLIKNQICKQKSPCQDQEANISMRQQRHKHHQVNKLAMRKKKKKKREF